jgi:p-cumate 2,3-dioxygenase beta subunit
MTGLRGEVEDFLFRDALLLDEWRLDEWLDLFTEDATYLVPPLGRPDADPATDTYLVNDDRFRLEQRVASLRKRSAHAESPRSITRRFVSNVQIVDERADALDVRANFCIFRYRHDECTQFVGHYRLALARHDTDLRFRRRVALLDSPVLHPAGAVTILL